MKKLLLIIALFLSVFGGCKSQDYIAYVSIQQPTSIRHGALYNYYAATDSRGFVAGWHLPSKTEVETLVTYLGNVSVAGGHLKETGFTYWSSPNTGADNSSGFNLRGSGYRYGSPASFVNILLQSFLWTSTSYDATRAWYLNVSNTSGTCGFIVGAGKSTGETVRLICDSSTDPGSVVIDGITYPTVKIGTQVWMAANLATKHYANGDNISIVTGNSAWAALKTEGMCFYNNDEATYK